MERLGIFSGDCFRGFVGEETELKTFDGKHVKNGDIVYASFIENDGSPHSGYLSAIMDGRFTTYSNDTITDDGTSAFFCMGIASCVSPETGLAVVEDGEVLKSGWVIELVKSSEDVVDGEHWKEFGINYRIQKQIKEKRWNSH